MKGGMFRRELLGEWEIKTEPPSPGPWSVRFHRAQHPRDDDSWVILDKNGRLVAECRREVDARLILAVAPRELREPDGAAQDDEPA